MVTVDLDENLKLLGMGAAKVGNGSGACNAVSDNRQGTEINPIGINAQWGLFVKFSLLCTHLELCALRIFLCFPVNCFPFRNSTVTIVFLPIFFLLFRLLQIGKISKLLFQYQAEIARHYWEV